MFTSKGEFGDSPKHDKQTKKLKFAEWLRKGSSTPCELLFLSKKI